MKEDRMNKAAKLESFAPVASTTAPLCVGDWVEVRSKEEILSTLDQNGRLEGLPFMPQMFRYCGQRFQVYKRAHKTCDTVSRTLCRASPIELGSSQSSLRWSGLWRLSGSLLDLLEGGMA